MKRVVIRIDDALRDRAEACVGPNRPQKTFSEFVRYSVEKEISNLEANRSRWTIAA